MHAAKQGSGVYEGKAVKLMRARILISRIRVQRRVSYQLLQLLMHVQIIASTVLGVVRNLFGGRSRRDDEWDD